MARGRYVIGILALVLTAGTPRFRSLNEYRAAPLWIAAEDALTPEGRLRDGAIAPAEETSLRHAFELYEREKPKLDPSACGITLGPTADFAPGMESPQSWDDVRNRARAGVVISGTVVDSKIGLWAGAPSTLLGIDAKRSNRALPWDVYLVYPRGSIVIDGVRVCISNPAYAELPQAGDRILFVAPQPLDTSGMFFAAPPELILYQRGERLVASPAAKRRGLVPFQTLDDFARALIAER